MYSEGKATFTKLFKMLLEFLAHKLKKMKQEN